MRFLRPDFTESKEKNYVDRKSTRLNSSHLVISYAVFCLKKKKNYEELFFVLCLGDKGQVPRDGRTFDPSFAFDSIHATGSFFFFFFNDTATTEIYTLSLHDALPI